MSESWHLDALTARIQELEEDNARLRELYESKARLLDGLYMGYLRLRDRHEELEAWIRELVKVSSEVLTIARNRKVSPSDCGLHCVYDDILDVLYEFEAKFPNVDDKHAG